jgi:25S rRNA (uracil2634-N3)-methyltransferase
MINNEDLPCVLQILELRTKVFDLNLKQIEQGYYSKAKELMALDRELYMLYKSITKYDFISKIKEGNTLLVGEGNLSFTISLIKKLQLLPNLIASTYEDYSELSEYAKLNTKLLKQAGVKILHEFDATELHQNFYSNAFDTIIFQFPHSGSREGINGVNANYVLVRNFIISASHILKRDGVVLITVVDSDFYNNMFRFDELAEELRISLPTKYKFDPKDYPEYEHTMTHQDESGIDDYSKFATYEFRL